MKILYIADFLYIAESGAHTSACAHLETLNEAFGKENVKVVSLVGKSDVNKKYNEIAVIKGYSNKFCLLASAILGYTTYLNKNGIKQILSLIDSEKVEFVFIDNSIYGILTKQIKEKFPQIGIITYYHDVKASLAKVWKDKASFFKKPVYQAMIDNEMLNQKYADVSLVLNDREERLFFDAYGRKPENHLPVYIPIKKPDSPKQGIQEPIKMLFFGGYYLPNIKGIMWFVDSVVPKLDIPIELLVAGREMNRLKDEYSFPSNVTVMGRVENLDEVYCNADVIVSPIFEGGGMKVKVAESMGYGKVIIGSDESYEGYRENIPQGYWKKYFYRANTTDEFIEAIRHIYSSRELLFKFNEPVRELFEQYYSSEFAERTIVKIVEDLNKRKD